MSAKPKAPRHRLSLRKRIAFATVLIVLSGTVALTLAEIVVRLFAPQPLAGVMFSEDPDFGFWLRPNLRDKAFQSEPGCPPYRVTTNRRGYRMAGELAPEKPQGVTRVLVMGDSFSFGVGVDNADVWPAQLEKLLNAGNPATRYEVVNASCPGWGTENELAFWRKRGGALQPDLVIVSFYRNDLWDNMRQLIYTHDGDRLIHAPRHPFGLAKRITRLIPFYRFLSEHSHLVNLARRVVVSSKVGTRVALERREEMHENEDKVPDPTPTDAPTTATASVDNVDPAFLRDTIAVYERLMEALIADVRARGVPLILAVVPGEDDCMSNPLPYYTMVENRAEEWQRAGLLRAVQLRPPLLETQRRSQPTYLPIDGHLNPLGNRIVAETLAPIVREAIGR